MSASKENAASKEAAFRPKARSPRGFQDRRGQSLAAERDLVAKISKVYEAWGFEALETGAFEYADALGKFLPDQDRPNEGVFALEDDDEQWMALRYDLTAPLARFVAENFEQLPKPYRRWAAGPVWRNEKPGPGRFREFWQCDADTVGSASPAADAEMIAMACEAYAALGLKREQYVVRVSTRKLLDGAMEVIGLAGDAQIAKRMTVLRAVDKLDRLGRDGVTALLGAGRKDESGDFTRGAGLSPNQIQSLLQVIDTDVLKIRRELGEDSDSLLSTWSNVLVDSKLGQEGIKELQAIADVLRALRVENWTFDPTVVRGLEYYTSTVFEAELLGGVDEEENAIRFGSIGGGGRYDDLVARFTGQQIPATGFSIGVSRLAAALEAAKKNAQTDGPIVVLPFDKEGIADCFEIARELRAANFKAEVYLGSGGTKPQLKYADKRNAPLAIILGGDERANKQVTVKDLKLGEKLAAEAGDDRDAYKAAQSRIQLTIPRADLIAHVHRALKGAGDV